MGLFKRLVIAIEKIADREPVTSEQMKVMFSDVLRNNTLVEQHIKIQKDQEIYDFLKQKQENKAELTEEEIRSLDWCEYQVKLGKLQAYKSVQ